MLATVRGLEFFSYFFIGVWRGGIDYILISTQSIAFPAEPLFHLFDFDVLEKDSA